MKTKLEEWKAHEKCPTGSESCFCPHNTCHIRKLTLIAIVTKQHEVLEWYSQEGRYEIILHKDGGHETFVDKNKACAVIEECKGMLNG